MPRHSRSRSKDRKREHKHKDKKKHRRHSRSDERNEPRREDSRGSHSDRRDQNPELGRQRSGGDRGGFHNHRGQADQYQERRFDDRRREEEKFTSQPPYDNGDSQASKKSSRFSDVPVNNQQEPERGLQKDSMPPPNNPNQKRKKFNWTDADENEMKEQYQKEKRTTLDDNQPAMMFGSNTHLLQNLSPAILNALQDSSKIKRKIYLPRNTGVNYIGLLIGPRGLYQKRLEEESGCKILIRGKGSQKEGSAPQPDDDDEQHVLIIGDSSESVRRAQNAIERVISADDSTRNKIREEQLVVAQQINNQVVPGAQMDDSMMTPYGPPSPYAYIIPVPNDCVGLIIGKGGETIRQLQMESGAKIQVAKKEIPNSNLRNVFVEGPPEKYQKAKDMIDEIIREHRRTADPQIHVGDINPFSGPHTKVKVPDKFVGLVIGKNGENLRSVAAKSNCKIFVPQKNNDPSAEERTVEIDGDPTSVEIATQEIFNLIQRYVSSSSSGYDYQKNPYGSGIAVYNQTKLASDGQTINGAVPDELKPQSGSFASSLLTENPSIAYASMQLTGWSYDDPHQPATSQSYQEGKNSKTPPTSDASKNEEYYQHGGGSYYYHYNYQTYPSRIGGAQDQQQYGQDQQQPYYDQGYYNYYQGQPGAYGYDQQQYNEYYQQYYGQQPPPQQPQPGQPAVEGKVPEGQAPADGQGYQYTQEYYNQYYQNYYYGQQQYPGSGEQNAQYYQQPYAQQDQAYSATNGQPPAIVAEPEQTNGGAHI